MSVARTRLDKIRRAYNKAQEHEKATLLEECRFRLSIAEINDDFKVHFLLAKLIDNIDTIPTRKARIMLDTINAEMDRGRYV